MYTISKKNKRKVKRKVKRTIKNKSNSRKKYYKKGGSSYKDITPSAIESEEGIRNRQNQQLRENLLNQVSIESANLLIHNSKELIDNIYRYIYNNERNLSTIQRKLLKISHLVILGGIDFIDAHNGENISNDNLLIALDIFNRQQHLLNKYIEIGKNKRSMAALGIDLFGDPNPTTRADFISIHPNRPTFRRYPSV